MLYAQRLSGPVLDRIDLVARSSPIQTETSSAPHSNPGTSLELLQELRRKIQNARKLMIETWGVTTGSLSGKQIETWISDQPKIQNLPWLKAASSLRSRHKIIRVALALATWEGKRTPEDGHFLEAYQLRPETWIDELTH